MASQHGGGMPGDHPWGATLRTKIEEQPEPVAIDQALAPLADVGVDVPTVQAMCAQLLAQPQNHWGPDDWRHTHPEFPEKFALAMYIYTLEVPNVYKVLGAAMHANDRDVGPDGVSDSMRSCLPLIKLLDVALVEAAITWGFVEGEVSRGVKWAFPRPDQSAHNPNQHYPNGREFHWYEFNSSSRDPAVMNQPWFCGHAGPRTIFTIQSVEGVSIQKFSSKPDEQEVLFRPLSRFSVTGCQKYLTPQGLRPGGPGLPDQVQLQQLSTFDPMRELSVRRDRLIDEQRARVESQELVQRLMYSIDDLRRQLVQADVPVPPPVAGPTGLTRSGQHVRCIDGKVALKVAGGDGYDGGCATCTQLLQGPGTHNAQFKILAGSGHILIGVVGPEYDVGGELNAANVRGHCFFYQDGGYCYPGRARWANMRGAQAGDVVGLELELDADNNGTMAVLINDERIGTMRNEGMRGPLRWAAELYSPGDSVSVTTNM